MQCDLLSSWNIELMWLFCRYTVVKQLKRYAYHCLCYSLLWYIRQQQGPLYEQGLNLIFIHIPNGVWDEATYPIPKRQPWNRWSSCKFNLFHPTRYNGCNYLAMLGLKLILVNKEPPVVLRFNMLRASTVRLAPSTALSNAFWYLTVQLTILVIKKWEYWSRYCYHDISWFVVTVVTLSISPA